MTIYTLSTTAHQGWGQLHNINSTPTPTPANLQNINSNSNSGVSNPTQTPFQIQSFLVN